MQEIPGILRSVLIFQRTVSDIENLLRRHANGGKGTLANIFSVQRTVMY